MDSENIKQVTAENEHHKSDLWIEKLSDLKEWLYYDPETGDFTWIKGGFAEKIAGCVHGKYITIMLRGQQYPAHVLAWFYVHGKRCLVDHKDRDGFNNRLINLREATVSQNGMNRRISSNNQLGYKGVIQMASGNYRADITVNGVKIRLGTHTTLEQALKVRREAATKYFGEFAYED